MFTEMKIDIFIIFRAGTYVENKSHKNLIGSMRYYFLLLVFICVVAIYESFMGSARSYMAD